MRLGGFKVACVKVQGKAIMVFYFGKEIGPGVGVRYWLQDGGRYWHEGEEVLVLCAQQLDRFPLILFDTSLFT